MLKLITLTALHRTTLTASRVAEAATEVRSWPSLLLPNATVYGLTRLDGSEIFHVTYEPITIEPFFDAI